MASCSFIKLKDQTLARGRMKPFEIHVTEEECGMNVTETHASLSSLPPGLGEPPRSPGGTFTDPSTRTEDGLPPWPPEPGRCEPWAPLGPSKHHGAGSPPEENIHFSLLPPAPPPRPPGMEWLPQPWDPKPDFEGTKGNPPWAVSPLAAQLSPSLLVFPSVLTQRGWRVPPPRRLPYTR